MRPKNLNKDPKKKKWVIGVTIALSFFFAAAISDESNKTAEKEIQEEIIEKQKEIAEGNRVFLEENYVELWRNYSDEDKGKDVLIHGKVDSVSNSSFTFKEGIEISTDSIKVELFSGFPGLVSVELEEAPLFKKGDFVSVEGRIKGKTLGKMSIDKAKLKSTGESSRLKYEALKTDLEIKDRISKENEEFERSQERERYIKNAIDLDYEKAIREPYLYKGESVKYTGKVTQLIREDFITFPGYIIHNGDNVLFASFKLPENSPRILEGDTVTFYGEFHGLEQMKTKLTREKYDIPRIKVKYYTHNF